MITLHSPPFGCSCPLFFSAHGVYSSQKRDSEFGMSTTTSCSSSKRIMWSPKQEPPVTPFAPRSRPSWRFLAPAQRPAVGKAATCVARRADQQRACRMRRASHPPAPRRRRRGKFASAHVSAPGPPSPPAPPPLALPPPAPAALWRAGPSRACGGFASASGAAELTPAAGPDLSDCDLRGACGAV